MIQIETLVMSPSSDTGNHGEQLGLGTEGVSVRMGRAPFWLLIEPLSQVECAIPAGSLFRKALLPGSDSWKPSPEAILTEPQILDFLGSHRLQGEGGLCVRSHGQASQKP